MKTTITTAESVAIEVISKYGKGLTGKDLENACIKVYGESCPFVRFFSESDFDNISDALDFYKEKIKLS